MKENTTHTLGVIHVVDGLDSPVTQSDTNAIIVYIYICFPIEGSQQNRFEVSLCDEYN